MLDEFLEPHQEPGVTEEEFAAFEKTYGVTLPEDMKDFYRKRNGGFFREGQEYFLTDDEYELPLAEFHGLTRTFHPHILTIEHMLKWQQADGFLPKTLVPFCSDQSGDSYFIEAGGQDNRIYYIFHEEYDEFLENPESGLAASSFTDFLEKIHRRPSEN